MDVLVFGVGRSGTTMTYSLLQSIFGHLYGDGYDSVYEPYIWDRHTFNAPYDQTKKYFGKTSSLSVEGIYQHFKTPLFVGSAKRDDYQENEFYRQFIDSPVRSKPQLAKLIRGNGRMSIFRALNPRARFLLVIRNPVDVVNSVKNKFCFFGEDFYPSDYPRFRAELIRKNKLVVRHSEPNWAEKQAEYCYQMNRAAVEFSVDDPNTMLIEYDNFIQTKNASVRKICEFLRIEYSDTFTQGVNSASGPVTSLNALSVSEYESALRFDPYHTQLCEQVGLKRARTMADIRKRYEDNCHAKDHDPRFDGLTTNRLRFVINRQSQRISELEEMLAKKNSDANT